MDFLQGFTKKIKKIMTKTEITVRRGGKAF